MPRWTVSINAADAVSFAAAKIEGCVIEFASRGTDTATLRVHPDTAWSYNDTVAIYLDGTRRFLGRVTVPQLDRAGGERLLTVPVLGVADWLNRVGYRQPWAVLLGDVLGDVPSSRVILNAAAPDTHLSADGQVADIVGYAAARGAPLAFGSSAVGIVLPYHEDRDLSCRQALDAVLRLTPSVAEWLDYTAAVPALHYGEGAAFAAARVEQDSVCWRHDLVVPGLQIEIERVNDYNGEQYRTVERLTAGDTDALDAVFITIPMAGREKSQTLRRLDVVTEAVGDITSAAWWQSKHPRLSGIAVADITVSESGRAAGYVDFPRIASVPLPDLQAAGVTARLETFWAVVDVVQRDGAGNIVSEEANLNLEMQFVTTDATTKTYRWRDGLSVTTAESTPTGLAAALLAHWSVLYAQGSFSCAVDDGIPHPGQTVLDSPVQTVRVDAVTNIVTGTFGPPSRLSAQDFVSFLNQARPLRKSTRFAARDNGTPPDGDESDETLFAPVSSSEWSPGEPARQVIASDGKKIDLDPGSLGAAETAEMRQIATPAGMAKALMTAPSNTGFDEEDIVIFVDKFKLKAKLVSKTEGEVKTVYGISGLTIEAYTSADKHKPLQGLEPSTGTYTLGLDYARMANGSS